MECNFENCTNFERLGKQFADRISELEKENKELREKLQTNYNDDIKKSDEIFLLAYRKNAYLQALQEIKEIAVRAMAKQQEYKKDFEQILDLITKAEEE